MWIVINIGCLECGISSDLVGVFDNHTADGVAQRLNAKSGSDERAEVFKLTELNVIKEEFRK